MARVAEKTRLNICADNKGADQPAKITLMVFSTFSPHTMGCEEYFVNKHMNADLCSDKSC